MFTSEFLKVINKARIESGKASYEYLLDIYDKIVEDNYEFLDIKFKYYKYLVENSSEINHENLEEVLMDIKNNNKTNSYIVYKTSEELNKKLEEPDKKKLDELKNELDKELKAIEEKLFLDENKIGKKSLGHYTSLKTLKYLVKPIMTDSNDCDEESCDEKNKSRLGSSLRLSHYRQMNDPLEGKVLKNYLFGEQLSSKRESHMFISAATTESDSLPMWRQYADNATGIFLEYHNEYLKKLIKSKDIKIAKVVYLDKNDVSKCSKDSEDSKIVKKLEELKKSISEFKDCTKSKDLIRNRLEKLSLCFKHVDYSYEQEYRIIFDKKSANYDIVLGEDSSIPRLYTYLTAHQLVYSKIIRGPKCIHRDYIDPYIHHCSAMMKIQGKNKSYDDYEIEIEQSKIAYR